MHVKYASLLITRSTTIYLRSGDALINTRMYRMCFTIIVIVRANQSALRNTCIFSLNLGDSKNHKNERKRNEMTPFLFYRNHKTHILRVRYNRINAYIMHTFDILMHIYMQIEVLLILLLIYYISIIDSCLNRLNRNQKLNYLLWH